MSSWSHGFAAESCLVWKCFLHELCFILLMWCTLRLKSLLWAVWKLYLWQSWSKRYTSSHAASRDSLLFLLAILPVMGLNLVTDLSWGTYSHPFVTLCQFICELCNPIQCSWFTMYIIYLQVFITVFLSENPKGWKNNYIFLCSLRHFILAETYFPNRQMLNITTSFKYFWTKFQWYLSAKITVKLLECHCVVTKGFGY